MQVPEPLPPTGRSDATQSRRPDSTPRAAGSSSRLQIGALSGDDAPTVRTGSSSVSSRTGSNPPSGLRVDFVAGNTPPPGPAVLPHPGERIDSFQLEEAIGVGGMGAVFRALDTRLDRHVALKILPPEQASDPEVVQRFYQEGRAAARLDHENIARVYTIGHDSRFHYIAFEYIEGTTARQRVERNGPLPVDEAINFTLQIADALVHAAERGVVHRDIKPSNIIVTPQGRAKLVDMGLARRFERGRDDGLTQSGMTLGTFDYISPEQARDPRDVDVRSDLYSLGCTLFHMLTGRPPFPEGTVLQKLIQHQEETPPDVRALNPNVPRDLASILVKLMAKDRERRYQTPEQLVRDLLTVAGTLGLRSVSPEGLVWLSGDRQPTWERHLVWALPALAFGLIVLSLSWWGQEPAAPAFATGDAPRVTLKDATPSATAGRGTPVDGRSNALGASARETVEPVTVVPAQSVASSRIEVDSSQDLLTILATAAPRSTIVLRDDGPYLLGAEREGRPAVERITRRDLTLKADSGVRPVLRLARDANISGKSRPALLDFVGGHVTLEGLEFVVDPGDRLEPLDAIRTEDTELTLRRCSFRRPGGLTFTGEFLDPFAARVTAVHVRATADRDRDRPPSVTLDRCHVDEGLIGLHANGPSDLMMRDCTLAHADSEPVVWMDNGRSPTPVAAELRFRHVSILAGDAAVFKFDQTEPHVWLDDSVVAAAGTEEATLVASDLPDAFFWRGRGNLYASIGTFLMPTDGRLGREAVRDPARWSETSDEIRERGLTLSSLPIWAEPDPSEALAQDIRNPTRAFRLATTLGAAGDVGVRQGPFGFLVSPPTTLALATPPSAVVSTEREPEPMKVRPRPVTSSTTSDVPAGTPRSTPSAVSTDSGPSNEAGTGATSRMNDLPEMPVMPPAGASREKPTPSPVEPPEVGTNAAEPASASVAESEPVAPSVKPDSNVIRTAEQLRNALIESGGRGATLRLAADADLELSGVVLRGNGTWRIVAEPGKTRPRLRFVPEPRAAILVSSLLELQSGSLNLEGIDVVLPRPTGSREGHATLFSLWPGTDLSLSGCTVTIEGSDALTSVVKVALGDLDEVEGGNGMAVSAATARVTDSLLRCGRDLVDVSAGRRLVLELNNAIVATGGSLIHAHGTHRGQIAERLSLTLRQVTAWLGGGLILLESSQMEPELPVAEVNARDTILSTASKDAPLVLVEGQDSTAAMRDRVVWDGHGVAYHQVTTYRRDQSTQVGAVPTLYDRPSWIVAVGAREQAPFHGDARFAREWDPSRPAWTLRREDVRLAAETPVPAAGCDVDRVPDAPVAP